MGDSDVPLHILSVTSLLNQNIVMTCEGRWHMILVNHETEK